MPEMLLEALGSNSSSSFAHCRKHAASSQVCHQTAPIVVAEGVVAEKPKALAPTPGRASEVAKIDHDNLEPYNEKDQVQVPKKVPKQRKAPAHTSEKQGGQEE